MLGVKISKDKYTSRWVDWDKLICVRRNSPKKHAVRQRRWLKEDKEVRHQMKQS